MIKQIEINDEINCKIEPLIDASIPFQNNQYIKRDWLGWRVVEPIIEPKQQPRLRNFFSWRPIKEESRNKFIWKNFLSKRGFVALGYLLIILCFGYLGFKEQVDNYHEVLTNPCAYCITCQDQTRDVIRNISYSPKQLNLTGVFSQ